MSTSETTNTNSNVNAVQPTIDNNEMADVINSLKSRFASAVKYIETAIDVEASLVAYVCAIAIQATSMLSSYSIKDFMIEIMDNHLDLFASKNLNGFIETFNWKNKYPTEQDLESYITHTLEAFKTKANDTCCC
jgi:hypothetical protein